MALFAQTSGLAFLFCLSVALLPATQGNGFLGYNPVLELARVRGEVKDMIAEALGNGHVVDNQHLNAINATISPIFDALPKNSNSRISAPGLRHVVHRYFGEALGWVVKGFEPHAANITEAQGGGGKILRSNLPGFAAAVIEKEMSHGGFALKDVVSAIVVVEQLMFNEATDAVDASYRLNQHSPSDMLGRQDMFSMLHSYMILEMLEGNASDARQHFVDRENIQEIYPNFERTALFLEDLTGDFEFRRRFASNPFAADEYCFEDTAHIAEEFTKEFSRWSNHECIDMKEALVEMDKFGTGRVRLADFYRMSEGGAWQFLESAEYLRTLGVLDESSTVLGPQVIIPNYVTGSNNCIASTPFYSACCINECMGLMHQLESQIRAPSASASEVAQAVEHIVSSSMTGPRTLTASLRSKLDEVANVHGGKVPLHGRLLAQWLHYAFPRECPFPHVTGTVSSMSPFQYAAKVGEEALAASPEEMELFLSSEQAKGPLSPEAGLSMWSLQEELIAAPEAEVTSRFRSLARAGALIVMIGSFGLLAVQHLERIRGVVAPNKVESAETFVREYDI